MGYSPRQIDEMTLWEFKVVKDAFVAFNSPDGPEAAPPTDEEFERVCLLGEGA